MYQTGSEVLDRVLISRCLLAMTGGRILYKSRTYSRPSDRNFLDWVLIAVPWGSPRKRKAPMTLTEAIAPTGHSQSTWPVMYALFAGQGRGSEIRARCRSALSLVAGRPVGLGKSDTDQAPAHLVAPQHEARFLDPFLIGAGVWHRNRWISLFKSMTCERFMALIFLDRVLIEGGCCSVEP